MSESTIDYDTYKLSCHLPPAGSEECLVFLHGLQSNKSLFDDLRQLLHQKFDYPQFAMDYLGFGNSSKPGNFSYDLGEQTDMVIGVLKKIGIKKVHLVGHSRGGMIGTLMLQRAPEMMLSLVSMEGNLQLEDCGESRNVAAMDFDLFQREYYPMLKAKLETSSELSAQARRKALELIPDYAFYRTAKSIVVWAESGRLHDIFTTAHMPRLLICGKNSGFQSRPQGQNASIAEINHATHFMLSDNPVDTVASIMHFLSAHIHLT